MPGENRALCLLGKISFVFKHPHRATKGMYLKFLFELVYRPYGPAKIDDAFRIFRDLLSAASICASASRAETRYAT